VDSVANLHKRQRATETVLIQVEGAPEQDVRRRLEEVAGVASVVARDGREGHASFEVQGLEHYVIRPDLARAVVTAGWNLVELRAAGESLEEIFLELTKSEQPAENPTTAGEVVIQ
jgi:hypothetical protein